MPACVEQVLQTQTVPEAPGTDLHHALALASEMITPDTKVFLLSDFVSTTGPFALDEQILALTPEDAAAHVAINAPVDLRGATLTVEGIGNTSTELLPVDRVWLRELAVDLCSAWNATGCTDITTNPVNATSRTGLPDDPMPAFPAVTVTSLQGACTFEVPESLTFAGDSADLADGAEEVFAPAIKLLSSNSSATTSIVGHTASSSAYTPGQLLTLSKQRAEAVATIFTGSGINESRLTVTGVGDTQPKVEDIDPATGQQISHLAAQERRVDVIIKGAPCPS
ncbi:MAG: OmpA family protein [Ancrocorticia sp.]